MATLFYLVVLISEFQMYLYLSSINQEFEDPLQYSVLFWLLSFQKNITKFGGTYPQIGISALSGTNHAHGGIEGSLTIQAHIV